MLQIFVDNLLMKSQRMLARQDLNLPTGQALLFERWVSVYEWFHLSLQCFFSLNTMSRTSMAPNFILGLIFHISNSSTFNSYCQFRYLHFLLHCLWSRDDSEIKWMVVLCGMRSDVLWAESIKTFHAYEQSICMGLNIEICTTSLKHLTHWSL